jgi:hypothetical protein
MPRVSPIETSPAYEDVSSGAHAVLRCKNFQTIVLDFTTSSEERIGEGTQAVPIDVSLLLAVFDLPSRPKAPRGFYCDACLTRNTPVSEASSTMKLTRTIGTPFTIPA